MMNVMEGIWETSTLHSEGPREIVQLWRNIGGKQLMKGYRGKREMVILEEKQYSH